MSSKSRSLKSSGKRSFTINAAFHVDGCPTKFSRADYTGRYISATPERAAAKALRRLCHVKRIKGQCTLYIEIRETTQGTEHKVFAYHAKRIRLAKPIERKNPQGETYMIYYKPVVKSVERVPTEKCPKSHKSSGRMIGQRSKLLSKKSHSKKSHTKKSHTKKSMSQKLSNTVRNTMTRVSKML
jgi:hypothetical protein